MSDLRVVWDADNGLVVSWEAENGLTWRSPVRVVVDGWGIFSVWGSVDSGEGAPVWAEKGLRLICFGSEKDAPGASCEVEATEGSFRAIWTADRISAALDIRLVGDELGLALSISCPQQAARLPVCGAELILDGLNLGPDAFFLSAHAYGGRTHGYGLLSGVTAPGLPFVHGCIGQALPVVYLHEPVGGRGLQMEFMLGERPTAWIRPGDNGAVSWALSWTTDRLLEPGQVHAYPGTVRIRPYKGRPVEQMRRWRDEAAARYGLVSPHTPDWARKCNIIEFNMNPAAGNGFSRLDDPACLKLLKSWKEMGYSAIFAVSPNHVGQNWLSPFDYKPCDEVGGAAGERQALDWAHELGFKIFLWVTTVGIDRDAPEVKDRRDWFTQRPGGELFYAWESHAPDYVGYAPDGDPLSTGWRRWLEDEVTDVIDRGYDGIFVDGCIPRASNHARWSWPGESRNSVEDQVADLADHVRALGKQAGRELITFVEDEGTVAQAATEMTMGRYTAATPFVKKVFWDHGMGGGPEVEMSPPSRIEPEQARDYLLVRYGSVLPNGVDNDVLEGYYSEEARPWTVQSLLAGVVPKTHSQYVDDPATFRELADTVEVPDCEQTAEHRLAGHEEFLQVLKFCLSEPLIRDAPLSIEGVIIEGDDAVVGLLRPGPDRALLALIQFANRPAAVKVRLAYPGDIPAIHRESAGHPELQTWKAREIVRSMVETGSAAGGTMADRVGLDVRLGAYGFRVFELIRGGSSGVVARDDA